jgi:Nuclease-related domain
MAYKRREHDRACRCDRADAGCAALAVQSLSRTRVQELAEEIWTVSTGTAVPVQPLLDPRSSRPGASAQAAYRRRRHQEHEQWRDGSRWRWRWRWWVVASGALGLGLLVGPFRGAWVGVRVAVLAGLLGWWRLRFHPSASARLWRRQAQMQRRTAGVLAQLEQEGWLVLHDIALPGWLTSLDHLVIGPTGAWAIDSWWSGWLRRRKLASVRSAPGVIGGSRPDLGWKAEAVADSLAGTGISVQPLLCLHVGIRPRARGVVEGIPLVALRRLPDVVRDGSRVQPSEVERASARAVEVLRPAA